MSIGPKLQSPAVRKWPKFQLRLPPDVKEWVEADAARHLRSMNGHVLALLMEKMGGQASENQQEAIAKQ